MADGVGDLLQRIKQWNATRLDLFRISEPNRRNEFNGVVRFFFQGDDGKYQAKCLRISNSATACQLVNTLVEKFHPDLKMLTAGRYALYEYNSSSGERRLGANEAPLLVQLNWAYDEREVRFILRDESKPLPAVRKNQALENQPGSLPNGTGKHRSNQRLNSTADAQGESGRPNKGFARRWSSDSRKKKKKSANGEASVNGAGTVPDTVPDSSFTRTLSNPDEVLRRRRQQRVHNRAQHANDQRTNNLKIYGDALNSDLPYVTLQLSSNDTAETAVLWSLEKYGLVRQVDPRDYCLVQVNIPPRGERLPMEMEREITLHQQDCPWRIKTQLSQHDGISCVFQIRHRSIPGRDGRRPPPPPPTKPRCPPHHSRSRTTGKQNGKNGRDLLPYLIEVASEHDQQPRENGVVVPLIELFDRLHVGPIKLGTIEKMVGPPPNILIDRMAHQDIRPVHCTFSVVQASTSASRLRIPKGGSSTELDANSHQSLLVSPSLDGFAKPPGPALMRMNGARIAGPMLVPPDSVLLLGKSLMLKFVYSDTDWADLGSEDRSRESESPIDVSAKPVADSRHSSVPPPLTTTVTSGKHFGSESAKARAVHQAPEQRRTHKSRENGLHRLSHSESDEFLPLSIELRGTESSSKVGLLDRYVYLVDQVLTFARSDLDAIMNRNRTDKGAAFTLSPAYTFYLIYRALQKQLTNTPGVNPAEKDHQISYITNYIATRVYESLPSTPREEGGEQLDQLYPLVYWLANSSELLHFFKNDVDLCSPESAGTSGAQLAASPHSPLHVTRQSLHLLADCVDHCFHQLRVCMTGLMQPLLYSLVYPGDSDLQDDPRLDDRSINVDTYFANLREPIKFQALMQLLTLLMHHLRRTRVNASLTIQLFSQLFHVINAYMFNQVLINTDAKPREARQDDSSIWLTRIGATRLSRRLDRIKQWAQRQGLERAAECRLQRCVQACQLILSDRSNLDEFYQFCMGLLSLNSMQLEWLLTHLIDPPPVPDDWIDLIVTGGKEVNDRAIADEMEHLMHTARDSPLLPEIQLTESRELPLPLLLPPDGYASDTILTGAPTGLVDFLRSLESKRLIHVRRNTVDAIHIKQRPWTNCLRLSQIEDTTNRLSDTGSYRHERTPTEPTKLHAPEPTSDGTESESSDSSSEGNVDRAGQSRSGRYKPAPVSGVGSLKRPVQHRSLPDLTTSKFDGMAKEARVPVDSIVCFYLRKFNNSLGLSIVAAKAEGQQLYGIYVKEIVPGGAAARDGRLATGDQILAIGSSSLIGCAQSDAVATIAKNCRNDAGIQLTVARGAAKHHRILDLIRPVDGNQTVPRMPHMPNNPTIKAQHSLQPAPTFADLHVTDEPVDRKKALVQKIGSPVLPPSTRVGVRQTDESRKHSQTSGSLSRRFGRDGASGRQPGSLSRSTPSLNLAEVGMDESLDYNESKERKSHGLKSEDRSKERRKLKTKNPNSIQKRNQHTTSQPVKHKSTRRRSSSRSRSSSSSSSLTVSTSSGSDIVHEATSLQRPSTGQHHAPEMGKNKPQGSNRSGHQRPPPGNIQGSRSQPDIASKTGSMNQVPARRMSLTTDAEPKMPIAESVSDELSSLDSSSNEQTPCSLQDSGTDQSMLPEANLHGSTSINAASRTDEKVNGKGRIRHPPPPTASNHKTAETSIQRGRGHLRPVSESELNVSSRANSVSPARPQSAMNRRWRETDVDVEDKEDVKKTLSLDVNKTNSMDSMQSPDGPIPNRGEINRITERPKSQEHDSRTNMMTPGTSGSMTPTSMDTVIAGHPSESDLLVPYESGPQHFPTSTKPSASHTVSTYPTTPSSPVVADVSHQPVHDEQSKRTDEPMSETLMPPSHAVVHTTRWNEDRLPTFAPELLPDLPRLHRDPQRGRTKSGSADTPKNFSDNDSNHYTVNVSDSIPANSLVRADFIPANSPKGVPTGAAQGLPPRPTLNNNLDMGLRRSHSPAAHPKPVLKSPSPVLPPSTKDSYVPCAPVHPPGSSFASPPPTPTADCPQYHPPERLQPVNWNSSRLAPSVDPTHTRSDPREIGEHRAPETAPKPYVPAPFNYHQQSSKQLLSSSPTPPRMETDNLSAHKSRSDSMQSHSIRHSPSPTGLGVGGSSAASKVAHLEAELRALEAKPGIARPEELDRLRVELQFQRRLADRETLRKTSSDDTRPRTDASPTPYTSGSPSYVDHATWEEKRTQAERELEATRNRRLAELEQEHRAMLLRQEQRAKERSQWFEQHRPQDRTEPRRNGTYDEKQHESEKPDVHGRYGRPRFDPKQPDTRYAPQYPIQSRTGPQVLEGELTRSGDSFRVKKSVSFDKNLETISVYSPPTTPQDSMTENSSGLPNQHTVAVTDQTHSNQNSRVFFPNTPEPTNLRYQAHENLPFHSINKSSSSGNIARSSAHPVTSTSSGATATVNPIPNAELLPFKEKMRLFAQQIGEEPPKERSRISNLQRQLLTKGTNGSNNLH